MTVSRRTFLAGVAGFSAIGVAGCSDSSEDKQDSGGPIFVGVDDKTINRLKDENKTIIDVLFSAKYSCSYAEPSTETFEIHAIIEGEITQTKRAEINFDNCMIERQKHVSFEVEGLHREVLVTGNPAEWKRNISSVHGLDVDDTCIFDHEAVGRTKDQVHRVIVEYWDTT